MSQTGNYVRQGGNASKKFVVYVDPAFPEPDTYTVFFADFNPVEVHREPGETTLDFFRRVVVIAEEMQAEIMADNQVNYGNYRKLLERQWRYQFSYAQIYGGTHSECGNAFLKRGVIEFLYKVMTCDVEVPNVKTKMKAADELINILWPELYETAK